MTENPPSIIDFYLKPFMEIGDVIRILNQILLTHAIRKSYLTNWAHANNERVRKDQYDQLLPDLVTDPPQTSPVPNLYNGPRGEQFHSPYKGRALRK